MPERGDAEQCPNGDTQPDSSCWLRTSSAGRSDWSDTTPMDAGEALFGVFDPDETT